MERPVRALDPRAQPLCPALQGLADAGQLDHVALVDRVEVFRGGERKRQHAEVYQVLQVDPREGLDRHEPQTEVPRHQGRVFAARTLAVVLAAHHRMPAALLHLSGSLRIAFVDDAKGEVGHARDVAAIGQHLRASRHNLVGRDVVAHLQQYRQFDAVGDRIEVRQGVDIGTLHQFDRPRRLRRRRGLERFSIDHRGLRHFDRGIGHVELSRVGDPTGESGGRGGFRAAEKDTVLARARPAGEIARHGPEAVPPGSRRLAHADAAVASGLMKPGAGMDQVAQEAVTHQSLEQLAGRWIDVERDPRGDLPAPHHQRGDGEVAVAGIGRGADVGLVDRLARHLPDRHHVARAGRRGDQGLERRQLDLVFDIVARPGIGAELAPGLLAPLAPEEPPGLVVRREHAGGRAQLGAHVGDDMAVHRAQARQARAVVLDDASQPALHAVAAQHLEHDVLGADPVRQISHQAYTPDRRHAQVERLAGHGDGDVEPAGADRQHAERAGRAGVAVGTEQRRAGLAEPLHVNGVAHSVARPAVPDTETLTGTLQKDVIVRVSVIRLDQIVVHVLNRKLRLDPVKVESFQREHDERARCVLGQRLVDLEADPCPGPQFSVREVRGNELLREVQSQFRSPAFGLLRPTSSRVRITAKATVPR